MDPRDSRLRSGYYSPAQLLALGRIAELSALLETLLRSVLAAAMGIGGPASDALFLGDRATTLVNRIRELAKFADAPEWLATEGLGWAKEVESAIKARDDIMHRPPVMLAISDDPSDNIVGWNRARRNHQPIPIDDARLLSLVERLASLYGQGASALFWERWEGSFSNDPATDDC